MKSTSGNASSPLLELPSEVKNRIYDFVNGGNFFRRGRDSGQKEPLWVVLCRAIVSEEDAHGAFENASPLEKTMHDVANRKSKNSEATNGHRS